MAVEDLVLDDVVILEAGSQIPADAVVVDGSVQVNEALITGEADEITKTADSRLLSGSFVISGSCAARLTAVGRDSYINKLTIEATKDKNGEQSEMIKSLDRLVKAVGIIIIPVGLILLIQQYFILEDPFGESVTSMVAAVLGMIPEGLYMTASIAMVVSAMRLARQDVLVQNMRCIETVSYTHLDVYKRQFLDRRLRGGGKEPAAFLPVLLYGLRLARLWLRHPIFLFCGFAASLNQPALQRLFCIYETSNLDCGVKSKEPFCTRRLFARPDSVQPHGESCGNFEGCFAYRSAAAVPVQMYFAAVCRKFRLGQRRHIFAYW